MVKFFIFIFFLILESLILPAIIGPRQFFITTVFLLGLLVYGGGWRTLLYQIIPFALIIEFFAGESFGHLIIPFGLTGTVYLVLDKFINLSQNLKQEAKSFLSLMPGILILIAFNYIYAGLFIFVNTSYQLTSSWQEFIIFFKNHRESYASSKTHAPFLIYP